MLEMPEVSEGKIQSILKENYALSAERIKFLPLGNDAAAWVYRVFGQGREEAQFFLKLKKGVFSRASLEAPRFLREQGMDAVVAPLPSVSGNDAISVNGFTFILYPWIEGQTGMAAGLNRHQWTELGRLLQQLHNFSSERPICADLQQETFLPPWAAAVREISACLLLNSGKDTILQEFADFWQSRQEEITWIVNRCEALGQALRSQQPALVFCHSDIHTANILVDQQGALHLIDWDAPLYAPRERDLMFIFESAAIPANPAEQYFLEGYGPVTINPTAFAYYRYEWVVQEIGDYGKRCLSTTRQDGKDVMGTITRMDALRGFKQLFDHGDVVDAAYQADAWLKNGLKA
jgi:spectinomycin phosphotransferase